MRPSTFMTALCGSLAIASPIILKNLVTETVTDVVYITFNGGSPVPTQSFRQSRSRHHHKPSPSSPHAVVVVASTTEALTITSKALSFTTTPNTSLPPPSTTEASPAPLTTEAAVTVAAPSSTPAIALVQTADSSSGLPTGTDFNSTVLYHHNIHRRNHSSPDVVHDSKMEQYATQVADSCHYAHDLTPGGGGYGQNIAAFGTTNNAAGVSASHIVAQAITELWYNNEFEYFLPSFYGLANGGGDFEKWGHFSQIVWASTTGVGCSAQLCSTDSSPFSPQMPWWFTVCNYSPPGNMGGEYGKNINPPLGHAVAIV